MKVCEKFARARFVCTASAASASACEAPPGPAEDLTRVPARTRVLYHVSAMKEGGERVRCDDER